MRKVGPKFHERVFVEKLVSKFTVPVGCFPRVLYTEAPPLLSGMSK